MGIKMNVSKTLKQVDRAIEEFPDMIGDAVKEHTDGVFAITQILVPKRTPLLMRTGKVVKNSSPPNRYSYSIWYGDQGKVDYAAAVHEILKARHALPTQSKYVEQPLVESIPAANELLKVAANKAIRVVFK